MNRRLAITGAAGAFVVGRSTAAQPSGGALYITDIAQNWFKDGSANTLTALSKTLVHYVAEKALVSLPDNKPPTGTFQVPNGIRVSYRDDQGQTHALAQGGQAIVAQEAWFELVES